MARQICQHIIGMNPQRVGDLDSYKTELVKLELKDIPEKEDEDTKEEKEMTLEEKEDAESVKALDSALASHEELIRQDFVLNPEVKVGRVLLDTGIRVKDFVRYEVGEELD